MDRQVSLPLLPMGTAGFGVSRFRISPNVAESPAIQGIMGTEELMSKRVGLHIQGISSLAHRDWLLACQAPAIKVMFNNRQFLLRYKSEVGGLVTARLWGGEFDPDENNFSDIIWKSTIWADKISSFFETCQDLIDCVYLWNEVGQDAGTIGAHAEAARRAVEILHSRGWRVAVGAFSVGNPSGTREEIKTSISRFRPALEVCDANSLHEYSAPRMATGQGSYCLRYRLYLTLMDELAIPRKPLLIGETGIDWGVINTQVGWRGGQRSGQPNPPNPALPVSDYVSDLAWYDNEIAKDPDVLAAFIFNTVDNTAYGWQTFEVAYEQSIQDLLRQGALPIRWPSGAGVSPAPVPPPTGAMMPNVGTGFQKAVPYIGNFIEDEVYHFPGGDHEVSLAVAESGYATWNRRTNETIAYVNNGSVYRDWGNWKDGKMVKVSGL